MGNSPSQQRKATHIQEDPEVVEKQYKKRKEIIQELLETERRYVTVLTNCVKIWLVPFRDSKILSAEEQKGIFSIIEIILNFHAHLLQALEERIERDATSQILIADIFIERSEFLKMYTAYVNNYGTAMRTVSQCRETYPTFETLLQKCNKDPNAQKLDLFSHLIAPVQRLPRYQLLFTDLLKNTPESHADHHPLQQVLERIKSIAEFVNEQKRDSENIQQILALQESLDGKFENLLQPHRRYKSEGNLKIINSNGTTSELHYFLFNDLVILATPTSSKKNPKIKWQVQSKSLLSKTEIKNLEDTSTNKHLFEMETADSKIYLVQMESEQAKEDWIKDFFWARSKATGLLDAKSTSSATGGTIKKKKKPKKGQIQNPNNNNTIVNATEGLKPDDDWIKEESEKVKKIKKMQKEKEKEEKKKKKEEEERLKEEEEQAKKAQKKLEKEQKKKEKKEKKEKEQLKEEAKEQKEQKEQKKKDEPAEKPKPQQPAAPPKEQPKEQKQQQKPQKGKEDKEPLIQPSKRASYVQGTPSEEPSGCCCGCFG